MTRIDWTTYDLTSPSGRRVEVKSAAYLQSWERDYYSKILFSIAPRRAWNPDSGYSPDISRHSDLYVFYVYTATSRDQSILDLSLWDFYVLPTSVLDRKLPGQKSISLSTLQGLHPIVTGFRGLGEAIETISL